MADYEGLSEEMIKDLLKDAYQEVAFRFDDYLEFSRRERLKYQPVCVNCLHFCPHMFYELEGMCLKPDGIRELCCESKYFFERCNDFLQQKANCYFLQCDYDRDEQGKFIDVYKIRRWSNGGFETIYLDSEENLNKLTQEQREALSKIKKRHEEMDKKVGKWGEQ